MESTGISHWLDILIIVLYFGVILSIGVWTLFRPNRGNVQSYFLAGRTMAWYAVGTSLFSSNVGSEHFIGLAGAGAVAGISLILFEWLPVFLILMLGWLFIPVYVSAGPVFLILMLGWLFIPVYVSAGVYTLPEYIGKRYGGERLRIYLSITALVLYVITKLAVSMFSGALMIQLALGWNTYLSLTILLVITGLYTMLGGLAAVMYTDLIQTIIMIIGAIVVSVISFKEIGGYQNLEWLYFDSVPSDRGNNTTCGLPRSDAFNVFLDPVTGDTPWPGLVLQATFGALWYWDNDQVIVQRALAARSLSHAKGGSILAGVLKITPLFLLVFPGMISRILYPDDVACVDPEECKRICDNEVGCSNIAYPKLVLELLPYGARGLLMAVMLSAIMSSLTSIFNSASTVFAMDIWRKIRKQPKQRELLIVGRVFVVVMCVLAILWLPLIKVFQSGRLFNYINAVQGYIGSPLGITFLISVFWKRATEAGAFYGLLLAQLLGLARLVVELMYPAPPCGGIDERPSFLTDLHYLYFIVIQMVVAAVATFVISIFTTPKTDEELKGLTWWTKLRSLHHFSMDGVHDKSRVTEVELRQTQSDRKEGGDPFLTPIQNSQIDGSNTNAATNEILEASESTDDNNDGIHSHSVGKDVKGQSSNRSTFTNGILKVCGLEEEEGQEAEASKIFSLQNKRAFLTQSKLESRLLNVSAVILMLIVTFILGFYH